MQQVPHPSRRLARRVLVAGSTVMLAACSASARPTPVATTSAAAPISSTTTPSPVATTSAAPPTSLARLTTPTARSTATHPATAGYVKYENGRFAFTVERPIALHSTTPPGDDDGMLFQGFDNQVDLTVVGDHSVIGSPSNDAAAVAAEQSEIDGHTQSGDDVTLKQISGNVYTVSGYNAAHTTIFYQHTVVDSEITYTLMWNYPVALRSTIDPYVQVSVASFVPGPNRDDVYPGQNTTAPTPTTAPSPACPSATAMLAIVERILPGESLQLAPEHAYGCQSGWAYLNTVDTGPGLAITTRLQWIDGTWQQATADGCSAGGMPAALQTWGCGN